MKSWFFTVLLAFCLHSSAWAFSPRPVVPSSSTRGLETSTWGVRREARVGFHKTAHTEDLKVRVIVCTPTMAGSGTALRGAAVEPSVDPPKFIIAGAPASGKGTQCEVIKDKFGVVHLSTGDMLRAAVADGTEVGKKAKEFMDNGKLVPDDVIIGVVKDRLGTKDCQDQGWLLDGFPRTPAQATALEEAGIKADCFIFLNVPDEALVERVVGRRTDPETGKIYHMKFSPPTDEAVLARLVQRSDDTEEKVKVRLEQFHANVDAVKDSYSDICVVIDGNKAPAQVTSSLLEAVEAKLK